MTPKYDSGDKVNMFQESGQKYQNEFNPIDKAFNFEFLDQI